MRKTISSLVLGSVAVAFGWGNSQFVSRAADATYQFYYKVGSQNLSADPEVTFEKVDNFKTSSGDERSVHVGIKNIPVSVNNGYIYWNVGCLNAAGGYDMLFDSPKNVSFSSKKSHVSWLRVVIMEDKTVDSKAVSSAGFRVSTADGTVSMTPTTGYQQKASLSFSGTDKTFCIHYGSVNSETDLGVLTDNLTVSGNCLKANIVYDFQTNKVEIEETEWGDPYVAPGINPTSAESARCFIDNPSAKTITFVMDNKLWKVSGISRMEVRGSFTGWNSQTDCQMSHDTDKDIWYVTLPYQSVNIPGNSGQPEFKFVSNGSNYLGGDGRSFIPEGYVFLNSDKNNIVVFSTDDFETIKSNSRQANVIKKLTDFNLSTEEGQEEISNFRRVPGTQHLYRSYHPYKITKSDNATEPYRMKYVVQLAADHGITCDICLSENEERNLQSFNIAGTSYKETIPAYYQDIIANGRVLYVGSTNSVPTYNVVYYTPESSKFGNWVKEIVDFITDDNNPGPYEIHCRIGTDRTGVFSGVLAALCGASWDDIAADYQATNRMGIQEFRDYHLLQYAFQRLLSVEDINSVTDLDQRMADYFVTKGYLTTDKIETLRRKLGADNQYSGVDDIEAASLTSPVNSYLLYTPQGILTPYTRETAPSGLYIIVEGSSARKVVL